MSRPGRLSVRARLLVLLLAVTTAFLLVMATVTTVVLTRRMSSQFDADLLAAAARPAALKQSPGDFTAVAVTLHSIVSPPRQLISVTPTSPYEAALRQAISRMTVADFLSQRGNAFPLTLPGGTKVRAVEIMVGARRLSGGIPQTPHNPALLFVVTPVSVLTAEVSGILVTELVTGGVLLALIALGGRWLIGRGLAPLDRMTSTATRITTHADLTARMPDANDRTEVGRLGGAVNTMLDRIQQAFTARLRSEHAVRQFAADASHELRTPLTTIRGYAELYRQGALGDSELPDAMRRIEQEAHRMSTLVAELLELARLDRTSSLDLTETDLVVLVRDAVADARAVEPGRPIEPETPDQLVARVDEPRVRQVLANLLGNVREHTPPETPAVVRLARVNGAVMLEVIDQGPGMPIDDAAHAFDRFHRGSDGDSGTGTRRTGGPPDVRGAGGAADQPLARESGGSGLGLSIVQAIARAHGGEAMIESAPGRGTRVSIWLPAVAE